MHTKEELEAIKSSFLKNIGEVIKKHRKQVGWNGDSLGKEIGVSRGAISRYETATADISASAMAKISVVLDFPLREYIEVFDSCRLPGDRPRTMNDEFKKLIEDLAKKKPYKNIAPYALKILDRPPKPGVVFNKEKGEWELKPVEKDDIVCSKSDIDCAEFIQLHSHLDLQEEGEFFNDYIENQAPEKKELLELVYEISCNETHKSSDIKPLLSATINFITKDNDSGMEQRLKAYRKLLEYHADEVLNH